MKLFLPSHKGYRPVLANFSGGGRVVVLEDNIRDFSYDRRWRRKTLASRPRIRRTKISSSSSINNREFGVVSCRGGIPR